MTDLAELVAELIGAFIPRSWVQALFMFAMLMFAIGIAFIIYGGMHA